MIQHEHEEPPFKRTKRRSQCDFSRHASIDRKYICIFFLLSMRGREKTWGGRVRPLKPEDARKHARARAISSHDAQCSDAQRDLPAVNCAATQPDVARLSGRQSEAFYWSL